MLSYIHKSETLRPTEASEAMIVLNYKGESVEAPTDLPIPIASFGGNYLVWSCNGKNHQVRYGLQVEKFPLKKAVSAATRFGECLIHYNEWNVESGDDI